MGKRILFVGGGNMATSLIGGLLARGHTAADLVAADPDAAQSVTTGSRPRRMPPPHWPPCRSSCWRSNRSTWQPWHARWPGRSLNIGHS
jgi:hypothetical protein